MLLSLSTTQQGPFWAHHSSGSPACLPAQLYMKYCPAAVLLFYQHQHHTILNPCVPSTGSEREKQPALWFAVCRQKEVSPQHMQTFTFGHTHYDLVTLVLILTETKSVELRVERHYTPGQPVSAWCGPQPNSRLLLNYGKEEPCL
jgi:hypothetical protein